MHAAPAGRRALGFEGGCHFPHLVRVRVMTHHFISTTELTAAAKRGIVCVHLPSDVATHCFQSCPGGLYVQGAFPAMKFT